MHQQRTEKPLIGPGPERMEDQPPAALYLSGTKTLAGISYNAGGLRYYLETDSGMVVGTVSDGAQVSGAICGVWETVPGRRMQERDKATMREALIARVLQDKILEQALREHPEVLQFLGLELPKPS